MLAIQNISKSFDSETHVLTGISLEVEQGEIVCLLGPSGCGKTTLLRIVAGLEAADTGTVCLDERNLAAIPVHKRQFGLMFQEFALFPHRTVAENIGFGLKMAGRSRGDIARRVKEMLETVDLRGYGERTIFELSGGERQRVALARSLAPSPRLLMLDEPLGSLDRALREGLMNELRAILKQVGVTALYVTHDQQEAFAVADRVVVMHRGTIRQVGSAQEIYWYPAEEFVARFLGLSNLLPARWAEDAPDLVETPIGRFHGVSRPVRPGAEHRLLLRPQAASLQRGGARQIELSAVVRSCSFRGSIYRATVLVDGDDGEYTLQFDLPVAGPTQELSADWATVGQQITLYIDPRQLTLL